MTPPPKYPNNNHPTTHQRLLTCGTNFSCVCVCVWHTRLLFSSFQRQKMGGGKEEEVGLSFFLSFFLVCLATHPHPHTHTNNNNDTIAPSPPPVRGAQLNGAFVCDVLSAKLFSSSSQKKKKNANKAHFSSRRWP